MTSTIKRHKPKKTTNTVVPAEMQHPYAVQDSVVPGARSLSETIKLLNQKGFSKMVENATVLEIISPPGSKDGKTKYILPHLNMADGKVLEGYLCKIRLPEDVGSLPDPQDMFGDESTGSRDAFEKKTQNQEQKKIKLINYFEAVANHKTFAPLDPKNTKRPQPNSKVRVYCFSEPHMTAGSSIEGFYEIIDPDDSIFEEGTVNRFLEDFRSFVDKANTIVQSSTSNIVSFVAQAFSSSFGIGPSPNYIGEEIASIEATDSQIGQQLEPGSINKDVVDTALSYYDGQGGEYLLKGSGVIETIFHKGQVVLPYTNSTYCNGASFTIAMKVINKRNLFQNKTLNEVKQFQQMWYGNSSNSIAAEKQQGPALEMMGIGGNISHNEALPGDFAQIWRTNNSGHSVVFLGWVEENGKIVGLQYRSSQGKGPGSGVGNRVEYFSDSRKGSVRVIRQRTYISRIKP